MIIEVISAFFVAFSFGILFNVKGKYLYIAGFGGALGWFIYKLFLGFGMSDSASLFISSITFSIYCEICARVFLTPSTILSVCCLIPLVPGYGVYNALYEILKGNYIKFIEYAANAFISAGSLALGVIFISTLFRSLKIRKIKNMNQ